jgi:hypothetical protein
VKSLHVRLASRIDTAERRPTGSRDHQDMNRMAWWNALDQWRTWQRDAVVITYPDLAPRVGTSGS